MRTAINETGVSPALALYGENIAVPGAFVDLEEQNKLDIGDAFVLELQKEREFLRKYILTHDEVLAGPQQPNEQSLKWDTNWVLIKQPPLQGCTNSRYYGPFWIADRSKYPVITIIRNGVRENINVMRLKPYYKLSDNITKLANEFDFHLGKDNESKKSMHLTHFSSSSAPVVKPPMLLQLNKVDIDNDLNNTVNFDLFTQEQMPTAIRRNCDLDASTEYLDKVYNEPIDNDLISFQEEDEPVPVMDQPITPPVNENPIQPVKLEKTLIDLQVEPATRVYNLIDEAITQDGLQVVLNQIDPPTAQEVRQQLRTTQRDRKPPNRLGILK